VILRYYPSSGRRLKKTTKPSVTITGLRAMNRTRDLTEYLALEDNSNVRSAGTVYTSRLPISERSLACHSWQCFQFIVRHTASAAETESLSKLREINQPASSSASVLWNMPRCGGGIAGRLVASPTRPILEKPRSYYIPPRCHSMQICLELNVKYVQGKRMKVGGPCTHHTKISLFGTCKHNTCQLIL
jgi:hypothetical protein